MNTIARAGVPGPTKVQSTIQTVFLIALSIITVWTLYMVPSWQALGDPFLLAAVAGAVTVACLWLTRWQGSRAMKFERTTHELDRIKAEAIYERQVFFIRNLGFMRPTEARRISFQEALRFERIHEEVYRRFGFELVPVGPGNVAERCDEIKSSLFLVASRIERMTFGAGE